VIPQLNSQHDELRASARWIVTQHPEWGDALAEWFRAQLASVAPHSHDAAAQSAENALESMLVAFASHPAIQHVLADTLTQRESTAAARDVVLRSMARAKLSETVPAWRAALAVAIANSEPAQLPAVMAAARGLAPLEKPDALDDALRAVSVSTEQPVEVRVAALAVITQSAPPLGDSEFDLLAGALRPENPVALRSAAADATSRARLSSAQLARLCDVIESSGPLELARLLAPFAHATDEQLALRLLSAVRKSPALASLRVDLLRQSLQECGPAIHEQIDDLESLVNVDAAAQRKRIEELLPAMSQGDVRRGHAVYYSAKAACSACHRLGHAGDTIGPELTQIGATRTERDLVESILYPSLSIVRSYEPVLIITTDGRAINGAIRDETDQELILTVGADQEVRVRRDDIDELQPSSISVMPAGLDKQLTTQELADLVAFLRNAK
jgi:putative heme-binding domain-containing protein